MIASPDFLDALAWSLVHFLWQGAAIAALAAAVMYVFRSPATRYLVGIGALALMLASFAVTFSVLRDSPANGAELSTLQLQLPAHVTTNTWKPDRSAPLSSTDLSAQRDFLWVARAWLVVVAALALRIVFGLLVLEYLRRRNLVALPAPLVAKFTALQQRLGIRRFIRYCECQRVRVPAVIGFFRPVVLIPVRALTGLSIEQLEAVVAHELGHIKRFDVAVNFVQVIAETLFFFHPAVWWLNKRIRADREDCCDDVAVAMSGGSVGYAKALAAMATWRDAPRFAMAATGSPLAARVSRLLGVRDSGDGRTSGVFAATLVLVSALIAGAVSLGLVKPAQAAPTAPVTVDVQARVKVKSPISTVSTLSVIDAPTPVVSPEPLPAPAPAVAATPAVHAAPATPAAAPAPVSPPAPAAPTGRVKAPAPPAPARPARPERPASPRVSYVQDMKDAGFDNLDVDSLIALKVHGVTPEFIRAMRDTGLEPDLDDVIGMAVQGVTPEYVREVRSLGFKPDADQIISLKTMDVTPEYVKSMRDLGFTPDTEEIISLKVQDVTPEYVRDIRSAGFNPDTDQIISMKVHDVTPEYRRALEAAGFKMDVEDLISAKVMDITPEFIARAQKLGFKDLSMDKLIQLKNADVL
jgi:beta-lactamase regulating signal transducer with metallopeptidase domain